jgi:hypothetical protein
LLIFQQGSTKLNEMRNGCKQSTLSYGLKIVPHLYLPYQKFSYSHQLSILKREDFKLSFALSKAALLYKALNVPLEILISTELPEMIREPITLPVPFNSVFDCCFFISDNYTFKLKSTADCKITINNQDS